MSTKTKRTLCGVGAIILALALAIGGTFAYNLIEFKSNVLGNEAKYLARLVEDYDPNPKWEIGQEIKKEVSVKNMGGEEDFQGDEWDDIYVRVMLKEYMDITPLNYTYYAASGENVRFMVDKSGDFVKFAVEGDIADQSESIKSSAVWNNVFHDTAKRDEFLSKLTASDFVNIKGYYDDVNYWYLKTKKGDPNGQYGAWVITGRQNGTPEILAGKTRDIYSTYDIHKWDEHVPEECALETHEYVEWILGNDVVMLSDWDKKPVKAWILDPSTGWATWGNAIPQYDASDPQNETALLLEAIKPIAQEDGEIYYDIYVAMEATSLDEMPDDWVIKDIFDIKDKLGFAKKTVNKKVGDAPFASPKINGMAEGDTVVSWNSSNLPVATVDSAGVVTVVSKGTTRITATIKHKDNTTEEIFYDVIVTEDEIDNELKINGDEFETQNNDEDDDKDFGVYVMIKDDGSVHAFPHAASIPLEVILKDVTKYSDIDVVAMDSRFADHIEIKQDPRNSNKYSIFFDWFPTTRAELDDVEKWKGPVTFGVVDGNPTITTTVKLVDKAGKETKEFKVTFYYTNSIFSF